MIVQPMRLLGIGAMLKIATGGILLLLKTAYALLKRLRMRLFSLYLLVGILLVKIGAVKVKTSVYYGIIVGGILLFLISLSAFSRALSEKEGEPRPRKSKKSRAAEPAPQQITLPQGNFVLTPVGQNGQPMAPVQAMPQYSAPTVQYSPMPARETFEPRTEALPPVEPPPVYFRVAQNPNYVMAEYHDRVELYYETPRGLKYVRTDYKTRG